jgi:hypothetical protein
MAPIDRDFHCNGPNSKDVIPKKRGNCGCRLIFTQQLHCSGDEGLV